MDDRSEQQGKQSKHVDVSELEERQVNRHRHWFRIKTGMQVCGARIRKRPPNERCAQGVGLHPLRGRCRLHGGSKNVSGRPITTGVGVRFLKGRLGDIERQAKTDAATADLQAPVAALMAVASRVGEMVDERDTPEFRRRALAVFGTVQSAVASGNAPGMIAALDELGMLLEQGASEADALEQFGDVAIKLHNSMTATWRIDLAKKNAFNTRHMVGLFAEFVRIVTRVVDDQLKTRQITDEIEVMLTRAKADLHSE